MSEPRIALVAVVKNEGPYLLEWMAHHLMMGVDHIYLYDDGSTDNSQEAYEQIYKTGKLTIHRAVKTKRCHRRQEDCYYEWNKHYGHLYDWVMPWDADEFLWVERGYNLKGLISELPEDVGQVRLNWKMFASSGHKFADYNKLVIERYTHRALEEKRERTKITKCIVRLKSLQGDICTHCSYIKPEHKSVASDLATIIEGVHAKTPTVIYKYMGCSHYSVKSVEEFLTIKRSRGHSNDKPEGNNFGLIDNGYFTNDDRNDVEDRCMIKYVDSLKRYIQENIICLQTT